MQLPAIGKDNIRPKDCACTGYIRLEEQSVVADVARTMPERAGPAANKGREVQYRPRRESDCSNDAATASDTERGRLVVLQGNIGSGLDCLWRVNSGNRASRFASGHRNCFRTVPPLALCCHSP
jgi:hypothetical protein